MTDLTIIPASNAALPDAPMLLQHWIGGAWQDSADGATSERRSPAHDVPVSVAARGGVAETEAAVAAARAAFDVGTWSRGAGKDRATLLLKVADLIDRDRAAIARQEVLESGKPISQALSEIEGAADLWRYAAALARTLHGDSYNSLGPDMLGLVLKEPVGVAALIAPWNFPFLIVSQKLPFALAAGCTAVVKPSELTPGTTVMLGRLLQEAGLPDGVVNIVLGFGDPVGETLSTDPRVDMVSFTGSTGVGRTLLKAAADQVLKPAMELGGNAPCIVFDDADMDTAIEGTMLAKMRNLGEACTAANRIYVHEDVAQEFTSRLTERMSALKVGDGTDPSVDVGPLVNASARDKVAAFVADALARGAKLECGGTVPNGKGYFYPPTVLSNVSADAECVKDEIFGPVVAIQTFNDQEDVIARANDTEYGLVAYVFSEDFKRAMQVCERLEYGMVGLNRGLVSDPAAPFGGVKHSGLGREGGHEGMLEFMETQYISANW